MPIYFITLFFWKYCKSVIYLKCCIFQKYSQCNGTIQTIKRGPKCMARCRGGVLYYQKNLIFRYFKYSLLYTRLLPATSNNLLTTLRKMCTDRFITLLLRISSQVQCGKTYFLIISSLPVQSPWLTFGTTVIFTFPSSFIVFKPNESCT